MVRKELARFVNWEGEAQAAEVGAPVGEDARGGAAGTVLVGGVASDFLVSDALS